ncbi:MAG TPA: acyl-CoA dehydrogenase family protein [Streptosporangiaceae bacterium]|nr:acyl-CoA dehydrogenase family protein [Streptosporangiaceae bacterium]
MSTSTDSAKTGPAATAPAAGGLPDLLYGEAETELRAAVRSLLEDRCGWREVLARTETDQTYDTGLWRVLAADLGCAGLLIAEDSGGAGASYREAAVVAEETGRGVAPVPFLGSAVVATEALLAADDRELLAALAAGTTTAALAVPFAAAPSSGGVWGGRPPGASTVRPAPTVRLVSPAGGGSDGYWLTGTVAGVADALPADVLVVPADGVPYGLYAVSADSVGLAPVVSLDMTRQLADLTFEGVPARRIASGGAAHRAVARALDAGAAMLASEQFGAAERCLEMTVAYLKERRQFGRQIGSFQALKHRVADLWVGVTQARAAARYAAACLAAGAPDTPVAIALAKAACSDIAVRVAQEGVQLHGGIGFTWEHPAHLYLKRAKSSSIGLGTADWHRASLAGLAGLDPPGAGR